MYIFKNTGYFHFLWKNQNAPDTPSQKPADLAMVLFIKIDPNQPQTSRKTVEKQSKNNLKSHQERIYLPQGICIGRLGPNQGQILAILFQYIFPGVGTFPSALFCAACPGFAREMMSDMFPMIMDREHRSHRRGRWFCCWPRRRRPASRSSPCHAGSASVPGLRSRVCVLR